MTTPHHCTHVAVVDDEPAVRAAIAQTIELDGLTPLPFASAESALAAIDAQFAGVIIADLRMPGMDGAGLFNRMIARDPDLPIIMISGHGDIETAVDLVRRGAYDFLPKPFGAGALLASVRRALEKRSLVLDNRRLRARVPVAATSALWGESRAMEQVRATIAQLATADIDTLIHGETGTGKTMVAAAIHRRSKRASKPLVTVDCGALPLTLPDSELFGHVSGAFPGAQFPRTGQLSLANGATLLLDGVD
ncbi:MAG: sigma-54-dependent transcriptional regulator, partial [Sphingopyxis sp.]